MKKTFSCRIKQDWNRSMKFCHREMSHRTIKDGITHRILMEKKVNKHCSRLTHLDIGQAKETHRKSCLSTNHKDLVKSILPMNIPGSMYARDKWVLIQLKQKQFNILVLMVTKQKLKSFHIGIKLMFLRQLSITLNKIRNLNKMTQEIFRQNQFSEFEKTNKGDINQW